MGNEANHVIDGLTVLGTLAIGTVGDSDTIVLGSDTSGRFTVDAILSYLSTSGVAVRPVGDVLQV